MRPAPWLARLTVATATAYPSLPAWGDAVVTRSGGVFFDEGLVFCWNRP